MYLKYMIILHKYILVTVPFGFYRELYFFLVEVQCLWYEVEKFRWSQQFDILMVLAVINIDIYMFQA